VRHSSHATTVYMPFTRELIEEAVGECERYSFFPTGTNENLVVDRMEMLI